MASKRRFGVLGQLLCALCFAFCVQLLGLEQHAQAEQSVSADVFYESLSVYGKWIDNPRFGFVWKPMMVGPGWRPYSRGRWVLTTEYGWLWDSDEEWGWATYHYGRWYLDQVQGWIWVPGDEWGPAWVDWRSGEGYIGWAPLPPSAVWAQDHFAYDADMSYQAAWVFVAERDFVAPNLYVRCVPPTVNIMIINRSVNVANYTTVNNVIVNRSINIEHIQAVTRTRIQPISVTAVSGPQQARGLGSGGRGIAIFKPQITASVDARRSFRVQRVVRVAPIHSPAATNNQYRASPTNAMALHKDPTTQPYVSNKAAPSQSSLMAQKPIVQKTTPALKTKQPISAKVMSFQAHTGLPAAKGTPLPKKPYTPAQTSPQTQTAQVQSQPQQPASLFAMRRPPPPGLNAAKAKQPAMGAQFKKPAVMPKAPPKAVQKH